MREYRLVTVACLCRKRPSIARQIACQIVVGLSLTTGLSQFVLSQEPADKKPSAVPAATSSQQIQTFVEQLGSNQFRQREEASAALLKIGEPALMALSAVERGRDAEVRVRARAIRERIEREKFEGIAQSFRRDPDPTASYGLPGWKSFSQAAGTSRPAKRLFLKMLQRRRLVALCLESLEGGSVPEGVFDGLPEDAQARLWTVVGKTCMDVRHNLLTAGESAEPGDLITLLVASQVLEQPPQDVHEAIRLQCNMGALDKLMNLPGATPASRKMLGGWFRRAPITYSLEVFSLGRMYQVPEAGDMARRVLESPADYEMKASALIALSNFGNASDLPLIDKFVENRQVLEDFYPQMNLGDVQVDATAPPNATPRVQRNTPVTYQRTLGDVALAAGLKISEVELKPLFPGIRIEEIYGMRETTIGFPVDQPELREKAIKVYRDIRAKNNPPAS